MQQAPRQLEYFETLFSVFWRVAFYIQKGGAVASHLPTGGCVLDQSWSHSQGPCPPHRRPLVSSMSTLMSLMSWSHGLGRWCRRPAASWWRKLERSRCQRELRRAALKTSVMKVRLECFGLKETEMFLFQVPALLVFKVNYKAMKWLQLQPCPWKILMQKKTYLGECWFKDVRVLLKVVAAVAFCKRS